MTGELFSRAEGLNSNNADERRSGAKVKDVETVVLMMTN